MPNFINLMTTPGKSMSNGCMMLFGMPFLGAGLFIIVLVSGSWVDYFRSETWDRLPATIISAELKSYKGSKGGSTYDVACHYKYRFREKDYESDRVDIEGGSSSEYDLHTKRYEQLARCRDGIADAPLLAYVNPENPSEVLLFRDVDMFMLIGIPFGLVFASVGAFVIFLGAYSLCRSYAHRRALRMYPNEPWLAVSQWRTLRLNASTKSSLATTWGIGIFLTLFMSIFMIALSKSNDVPAFIWLSIALFIAFAAAMVIAAIYATGQYLKYGQPVLAIDHLPLEIGKDFTAVVAVGHKIEFEGGITCSLICESILTTRSGGKSHTSTSEIHNETITVKEDMNPVAEASSVIPVSFTIPAHCPQRDPESNPRIAWKLKLSAATPGIDFAATFDDLPVYSVEQ